MNVHVADLPPAPGPVRVPVSGGMFDALAEAGMLDFEPDVELRDGVIVQMSPQYSPHLRVKSRLYELLLFGIRRFSRDLIVASEGSVATDDHNRPMPDIIVATAFPRRGPVPAASVLLAVEVSATTLADDLGGKPSLYAAAGIPEYWVADVHGEVLHLFSRPDTGSYQSRVAVRAGEPLASVAIPQLSIETAGLFDD